MIRSLILFLTLSFCALFGADSREGCAQELTRIDKQIEKLIQQRDQHGELASKYQQQGDRWQYSTGNIDDAYAAWNKASQERSKFFDLQQQIDQLREKKERIYRSYPSLRPREQ